MRRQLITIALAALTGAAPAAGQTPHRGRGHVPEPDLHQVVRRLQQEDRRPDQLPVDRLRRRHPPVHRGHGRLRRHRRPDERVADRGGQRQRAPRAHGARRRRGDLQPARRSATPSSSSTAPTLVDIFMGRITKWNDKRIAALNPGVKLPDIDLIVVHRSDGSGTTLHLHRLPQQVLARVEGQGRLRDVGQLAGRTRRQGQRGRHPAGQADRGRASATSS